MRPIRAGISGNLVSPLQGVGSHNHYKISYIHHADLTCYEEDIKRELRAEFSGVEFINNGLSIDVIIDECLNQPPVQYCDSIIHIIAFDIIENSPKVLGALFDIPTINFYGNDASDTGWFFTSSKLQKSARRMLANDLWRNAFALIKHAGYQKIETTIGTKNGKSYLEKTHGFYNSDDGNGEGKALWIKDL